MSASPPPFSSASASASSLSLSASQSSSPPPPAAAAPSARRKQAKRGRRLRLSGASTRFGFGHGLMVLMGLLTFVLVNSVLRDREAKVEVLVAAVDLEPGAVVGPDAVQVVTVTAADELSGHLLPAPLEPGRKAIRAVSAGEPLVAADLGPDATAARTFSLPVEARVLDGLGLRVGDRVDVIGFDAAGTPAFVAVSLAVRRLPASDVGGLGVRLDADFLTVEVDERQALTLVAALHRGELEIVRSTGAEASLLGAS